MSLTHESLSELSAEQMREMLGRLMGDLRHKQAIIDKLTHENAVLKRLKFAAQSERFSPEQRSLLEESLDADLQAVAEELEQLAPPTPERQAKQQPKRRPLPAHLPRREIRHDPESTTCTIIPISLAAFASLMARWNCRGCVWDSTVRSGAST